jgi:RND family efflux transporter MFP subunit
MERYCNPNEIINYNERLIAIGVIDPVHFVANIPQENLLDIRKVQEAEVIFDSFPNRVFTGKVVKVDPSIDAGSGTFRAYIEIDNSDLVLRPGLSGSARISNSRSILAIPRLGVVRRGKEAMVFVVESDENSKDRARIRKIVLGDTVSVHELEVLEGLSKGERVVVHGLNYVRDGDLVAPKERKESEDRIDIDIGIDTGGY